MSVIIPVYLVKKQIKRINERIPVAKRSKLLSQFILDYNYQLPTSKEEIQQILELETKEEMVILPIFFSEAAARIIDRLVRELREKMETFHLQTHVSRSTIIRVLIDEFATNVEIQAVEESEKQFILIHMPSGTKEKLDKHIDNMERSHTIDSFLSEEYQGPKVDSKALKARIKGEKEKLPLYLDYESIRKAAEIAESFSGEKIKKTHIIRDAISQLTERLEVENPRKRELEEKLSRTLEEFTNHANPQEIKEMLARYNIEE